MEIMSLQEKKNEIRIISNNFKFGKKSESILCDKLSRLVTTFVKRHKANAKKKITTNGKNFNLNIISRYLFYHQNCLIKKLTI